VLFVTFVVMPIFLFWLRALPLSTHG
jgi:hypothetical protein